MEGDTAARLFISRFHTQIYWSNSILDTDILIAYMSNFQKN